MKIALLGYGKMGQMTEKAAHHHGHTIVAKINSSTWDKKALNSPDICIDFSHPSSALDNIHRVLDLQLPLVIGTTGWYDKLEEVKGLVEKYQSAVLYGPNFSVGIFIWMQTLAEASKWINAFEGYEAAGIEQHHAQKLDSPSGTALEMARTVEARIDRLHQLPISSVRCGYIPGIHTLTFDSACDNISITHTARNRKGFADGAIIAAEWLLGKKGFYSFNDCMQDTVLRRLS
jgi:4-hydroxy-tetrahydrodipicolinate reductase